MFLLFAGSGLRPQGQKVWIGDTARVRWWAYNGDTSYSIRDKERNGEWTIYYDDKLTVRCVHVFYRRGFDVGDTIWYRSGQIQKYFVDKDSLTHGCYESRHWFPDGKLKLTNYCDGDTAVQIEYYHSGATKRVLKSYKESAINWMVDHYIAEYYVNGQLKYDPSDVNGSRQTIKNYYESGKVSREATYVAGALVGPLHEWYENGQLKVKGQYKDPGDPRPPYTIKTGTWSYYAESGKLIKEEFYEEGKLVKTVEY